uniref:Uncharacterized protein n=1 Tax=Wuchereria bancrofti TaxID=6293 RepID=A0AAF5PV17_WUCBA
MEVLVRKSEQKKTKQGWGYTTNKKRTRKEDERFEWLTGWLLGWLVGWLVRRMNGWMMGGWMEGRKMPMSFAFAFLPFALEMK